MASPGGTVTDNCSSTLEKSADISRTDRNDKAADKPATEKRCSVCQVSVKQHLGKHGPNNCLGQACNTAFQAIVSELGSLKLVFERECSEAKDREVRLQKRVSDLSRQLETANVLIEALSAKIDALTPDKSTAASRRDTVNGAGEGRSVATTTKSRRVRRRNSQKRNTADESLCNTAGETVQHGSKVKEDFEASEEEDTHDSNEAWEKPRRRRQAGLVSDAFAPRPKYSESCSYPSIDESSKCHGLLSSAVHEPSTEDKVKRTVFFVGNLCADA